MRYEEGQVPSHDTNLVAYDTTVVHILLCSVAGLVPHGFDFGILACHCKRHVLHTLALIGAVVIEWQPPGPFDFGADTSQTMEVAL